jgi:hypothetical protein
MSLNSFSQNDIKAKSIAPDTTRIQLTKPIARLVIKDLIKGDGMSQEIEFMQQILTQTNNKLLVQSDLNTNLSAQIDNFCRIVNTQAEQIALSKELTAELQKDLKKQKLKTKLFSGAGIAAVVGVLVLAK